jgi:hypothetical protein
MGEFTRREFIAAAALAAVSGGREVAAGPAATVPASGPGDRIDRLSLVRRHNVTLRAVDPLAPLQVGNGEFAFSCDVTGLQTLADAYQSQTPLNTMAQWAWHAFPNVQGFGRADLRHDYRAADGRAVPYFPGGGPGERQRAATSYLRSNPHRIGLVRIGLAGPGAAAIAAAELSDIEQTLDLWTGVIRSAFTYRGRGVRVTTVAHPVRDLVAIRVESDLFRAGDLVIRIAFPGPSDNWRGPADGDQPDRYPPHAELDPSHGRYERQLDATRYFEQLAFGDPASVRPARLGPDAFAITCNGPVAELLMEFSARPFTDPLPLGVDAVAASSADHWREFWSGGAAVDFSRCTDPRAGELERRVVLSQYLTAVNCAGSLPPQETGLVYNSWFGKHHLEMHWWHAAHFVMWGRPSLLERSLGFYESILPRARATAQAQGYDGARWPKMTDPDGVDSPSEIGVFLIWQQPHPIYYAEQIYRARPTRQTLDRLAAVVDQSARFMASYAVLDPTTGRYGLGPPMIPAQESYGSMRATNRNPTYELAYWAWGLGVANAWRERLGQPREAGWDRVRERLATPTVVDDRYVALETEPRLIVADHPSFLQAFGFVPATALIDPAVMRATLHWAREHWPWDHCWGWDFPVLAQTAARLNEPGLAVDALCLPAAKNRYLANGHNYQDERLTLYLPGNGGLLAAVAMMAGGWDGGPDGPCPGFPKNGHWDVRCEGFAKVI